MALDQTVSVNRQTVVEALADWAVSTPPDWPDLARERALHAIEDTVACMIAGADDESPRRVRAAIANWGNGSATVVGQTAGAPAPWAALANGTAAHALDYDDAVQVAITHASAVLVPALLALGEATGATGRQVVDAYLVGYELQMALGRGVNWSHYNIGWHSTSTLGTIGTAGGCARLLGLDAEGMAHAISLGVSMASGPKAQFGSMAKSFHAGLAAQHAIEAAQLAAAGLEGRKAVLEAPMGFLELFGGTFPPGWSHTLDGLGARLAILEDGIVPKRHPCCASTHKVLDALLDLRREHGFGADDVDSIRTVVGSSAKRNLAYDDPQDEREAKFSMQYCLALGLTQDQVRIEDFTPEAIRRPALRALLPRIAMEAPPSDTEAGKAAELEHRIEVRLKDGRELAADRRHARGTVHDPLTDADRAAKYADCVSGRLDAAGAAELRGLLTGFDRLGDLGAVTRFLRFDA